MQLQVETTVYKDGAIGHDITEAQMTANTALSNSQAKYAVSNTSSSTGAKVAILNPSFANWQLFNGAEIFVKFDNRAYIEDETTTLTLTIKSSSADTNAVAYPIKDSEGEVLPLRVYWKPNSTVHFMFDGTNWRVLDVVSASKYNSLVTNIDNFNSTIGEHTEIITSLGETVEDHATMIDQTADSIISLAQGNTTYTNPETGESTSSLLGSKIIQTATSIESVVANNATYTAPDGTTKTNSIQSAIKQNADNINLKVSKNDVINQINVSTEGVQISADKVNIQGATIFESIPTKDEVVSDVTIEYGVGSSSSSHTDIDAKEEGTPGAWSPLTPTWTTDGYVWQRTTKTGYRYDNIHDTWVSEPVVTYACIQGAKGDTGKSLLSITEYYKTNNDPNNPPTGTWSTSMVNPSTNEPYLWNYEVMTWSEGNPTETPKHIIANYAEGGAAGRSLLSITEYYARNNDVNNEPLDADFRATTPYNPISTARYVWNYEVMTWSSDPITSRTEKRIVAIYGEKGDTITINAIEYAVSNTEAQPLDSAFDGNRTIPSVSEGQWLWTRTTYSDGISKIYTKTKQGVSGAPGRSIAEVEEHYARNNDLDNEPSESEETPWGTTVLNPTIDYKYVWNYEIIKDSLGEEISRTDKRVVAMFSEDGDEGRGIVDITNYYARSTTATAPGGNHTSDPSIWTTSVWSLDSTNKYMWNYEVVTYTEGEPSTTSKRIIAVYGDTGDSAYTVILTNENHTFVGDAQHALNNQSTTCNIIGYKGSTQVVTSIGTITGNPSGMTISKSGDNTTSNSFTVAVDNTMESTHGVLNVPVTIDGKTFNMKFTYALALAGTDGAPAVTYSLVCNPASLVRTQSGLNPNSITFSATRTEGQSSPVSYTGRIKIEEYNGTSWIEKSSTDTNNISYSPTDTAKLVRATLYLVGGTTTQLDIQTVPIAKDGANGTSPTITSSYNPATKITTLTITDANGQRQVEIRDGSDGGEGAEWFFGTTLTHTSNTATATITGAKEGSMYINTTTCNVYKCTEVNDGVQTWLYIMCLAAENTVAKVEPIYTRTNNVTAPARSTLPSRVLDDDPNLLPTPHPEDGEDTGMTTPIRWTLLHESRIAPPQSASETTEQIATRLTWKYLWTCNQLIGTDGSLIGHTAIRADQGTTIIDGADITTGTITADQINVNDLVTRSSIVVGSVLNDAVQNASYSVEIKVDEINYVNNSVTLVAIPYYQGSTTLPTLPNEASYSYQWYSGTTALSNTSTAPTISGATTATLELGPGSDLEATYICVISKP